MSRNTSITNTAIHRGLRFTPVVLVLLLGPVSARAYVDPGTGSYMLQLLLAGLFGAALTVKVYWRRLGTLFQGLFTRRGRDPEDE
jgi:hypothetical protein